MHRFHNKQDISLKNLNNLIKLIRYFFNLNFSQLKLKKWASSTVSPKAEKICFCSWPMRQKVWEPCTSSSVHIFKATGEPTVLIGKSIIIFATDRLSKACLIDWFASISQCYQHRSVGVVILVIIRPINDIILSLEFSTPFKGRFKFPNN